MRQIGFIKKNITYTTTTATLVGRIPVDAFITDIKVLVTTAFNAGSTDYVDIGDSSTANKYADNIDVSSTGSASVTLTAQAGVVQSTTATKDIYVTYVPSGTSPSAGAATVVVEFAY